MRAFLAALLLWLCALPASAGNRTLPDDRYPVAQGADARDVTRAKRCAPPFGCPGQTPNAPDHSSTCQASHYGVGDGYGGRRTASGEVMNPRAMTAAHRTLPFGARVRVTHLGRSVEVRINDRGPFVRGRCIDLSHGAARAIGMTGVGAVTVARLSPAHCIAHGVSAICRSAAIEAQAKAIVLRRCPRCAASAVSELILSYQMNRGPYADAHALARDVLAARQQ